MHPSLRILLLMLLAVAIQFVEWRLLAAVGVILLAMAMYLHVILLRKLLYRSRWLLLTLLAIYAFTTPGEFLHGLDGAIAPTYEGITQGLLQAGRLAAMLAGLALLLGTTPRDALMGGIYWLLQPLCLCGIPVERFTARLWLTLHYVEQVPVRDKVSFWHRFDRAVEDSGAARVETVHVSLPAFAAMDWLVLVAMSAGIIGWLV